MNHRCGLHGRAFSCVMSVLVLFSFTAPAQAVPPLVTEFSPRGLQIGGTTTLTVTGTNLDGFQGLLLPDGTRPDCSVKSASATQLELYVSLPEATPGIYPLRLVSDQGLSNALLVGVDALPQENFRPVVAALPVALHGTLTGQQVVETSFPGFAGDRIVLEVEGRRTGSSIRPLMRVYTPSNRLAEVTRPQELLSGDTRMELELVENGVYRVELQDVVFKGPSPGWFRLKIGDLRFIDQVFPPAMARGQTRPITVVAGNVTEDLTAISLANANDSLQQFHVPSQGTGILTGAIPYVHLTSLGPREVLESDLSTQKEPTPAPLAISGQIDAADQVDTFRVAVGTERKLRAEIWADRWGSPLDAVLQIRTPDGNQIAESDDQSGTSDPGVDFEVPAGIEQFDVVVRSLTGQGSPQCTYRLLVAAPEAPTPTMNLREPALHIAAGQRLAVPIDLSGAALTRAIDFQLPASLRMNLELEAGRVEPHDEVGLVGLRSHAMAGLFATSIMAPGSRPFEEPVRLQTSSFPGANLNPSWQQQVWIAMTPPGPMAVDWAPHGRARYLARGTKLALPLTVTADDLDASRLRLTLLTTQKMPQKKVDNQDVDAPERALRLEATTPQAEPDGRLVANLLIPQDLPLHDWGLAVHTEWLDEAGNQVLASSDSSVLRLPTIAPITIELDTPSPISVQLANQSSIELHGTITRHADFPLAVTVTASGLDDHAKAQPVTLSADQSRFTMVIELGEGGTARELNDVRITATPTEPTGSQPGIQATAGPYKLELK